MKAPLRRLGFKGFFELLDRNSNDNDFAFVLERLDKDELKHQFDIHNVVFDCHIRDGDLCKILTPSLEDLSLFRKGNFDNYNNRLVHRLTCNICRCYKWKDTDTGYTPDCRPFDCYHYYYGKCLESWKSFHLEKNKGIVKTIRCSLCQSNAREMFENLYACEWKINGSGSMLSPDTRIEVIDIDDSVDVEVKTLPIIPTSKNNKAYVSLDTTIYY